MNKICLAMVAGVLAIGLLVFPISSQAGDETATVETGATTEPTAQPAEDAVARTETNEIEAPADEEYLYPFGEGCPFEETEEVPGTV